MNKLQAIPPIYRVAFVVILLLYVVIINIEFALSSQRYTLTVITKQNSSKGENSEVKTIECLGTLEGITQELKLQESAEVEQVNREKMHIFSKWLTCGVL